ncbi:MAG: alpha/beta hydrolase [Xanthomonadales bacterium]|nr:alpha/beta hydrolase [Xanthomonadales bacterium]MDH4019142.1 alpha/beta hydrolase [Xanthomonadales bacterium]
MNRHSIIATLLLLALPSMVLALPDSNTIEFSNCALALPGTNLTANARCGSLDVPENPEEPEGRKISLNIAIAPATGKTTEPDPVFFFAGGPGQAASETWVMIRSTLNKIRKSRDIVMIDQRGTGGSNKLECTSEVEEDLNKELDLELVRTETAKCLAELDGDPRFYTTTIAMGDYNRVREAMGYEKINIMGVSYGTRSAQVYLRLFAETVRTMTLDSVVPMQLALGQEHALMLDQSVKKVFEDCANDEVCNSLYPLQAEALNELFAQLRDEPQQITIINPVSGEEQEMRLTADTLGVAIRFLSYASETQAMIPLLVHEALTTGNLSRLATQAILTMTGLNEMLSKGMELSVMCSEDYPFFDMSADYSDTLMGNLLLEIVALQCKIWPAGEVSEGFHQAIESDLPVLLMSGERDPVTPPQYASQTAETFPNSLNLVARGQAHSVMKNVCLRNITTEFIQKGTVEGLDTSCVEQIQPSPFFTSLLGPDP